MTTTSPTTFALAQGVVGVFTGRGQDNLSHRRPHVPSRLARARRELAAALGIAAVDLHHMHQVHGGDVGVVDADTPVGAEVRGVDALATDQPGRALVVQVADCVPVLVAADDGPVGVAHAGRNGVAAGVVGNLVDQLVELGADRARLHAAIGPAIGGCCYEVPDELAARVAAEVGTPDDVDLVTRTSWGTTSLDLPAAVAWQLRRAGVPDVRPSPGCTRCDPDERWFSHRRDAATGRQVGVVVLVDPAREREVAA